ncbi:hypothetical protein HJB51_19810 [Rhizobium lentis]|uniref:hypothetical protein n=1 Tax=Rhizobium lentis TaxID=1138194 RepID=UPI001A90D90B|nr:hypothetical protein [Rhizobium lentis]MBX4954046.1 hypothetical protein [Rhizobium lentis]MBX4972430.1 hypothetical protein [Rhizobium lentis]MBX4984059.1 hypothetical protein [Rhizobium lentis]MBX5002919.1 hypothetical protein [Rhizobium lentis]MBX5027839.1 hypothetical protein [Rhizobium lentis]
MSKDSHAGKEHGSPREVPPARPDIFADILKPVRRDLWDESHDQGLDDEHTEGRNWAILLTVFSFLLVQIGGIALIVWLVFW